jgi:hypothetical protein
VWLQSAYFMQEDEFPPNSILGNSEHKKGRSLTQPRPFSLSSPYSALLSSALVGSSMLGTLAQEVMTAATFSVLR